MARLLLSIAQHGLQLCFQIRSEVCASVWSSAICYGSATCRLQSETKQRTRVYAGLCGRCGWMCWEGEVVRLELGLRMLYLISQCRRRSGGRCRRRAKTSSYLVPVLRAALAWLASSCCQWPQRVQLLVTCAQPPSPHRPYWLRLSFSIRISRALSGPACDDPRTATIRQLRTCASLPPAALEPRKRVAVDPRCSQVYAASTDT